MKRISKVIIAILFLIGIGFISQRIFIDSKNKEVPIATSLTEDKAEVKEDIARTIERGTAQDNHINLCDTLEIQKQIVDLLSTKENMYPSNDTASNNSTDSCDNNTGNYNNSTINNDKVVNKDSNKISIKTLSEMYAAYESPKAFNEDTTNSILNLAPIENMSQNNLKNKYDTLDTTETSISTDNPYQIVIPDTDKYTDDLNKIILRYIASFESEDNLNKYTVEDINNLSIIKDLINIDVLRSNLVASDSNEFAIQCSFKLLWNDAYGDTPAYKYDWGDIKDEYIYCDWTILVKHISDNTYQIEGIAKTSDIVSAFTAKYPENNYLKQLKVIETESTKDCSYIIKNNNLYVSYDGGSQWKLVPITMEELLHRGDCLTNLINNYYDDPSNFYLEEESYYITPQKTVFVYGGSSKIPLSIISSNDAGNTWTRTVVDADLVSNLDFGVRRTFISFSGNDDCGYLVVAGGRLMYQEENIVYKTTDGGTTWNNLSVVNFDNPVHSLTISAAFSTDKIGFITMRGSQDRTIWYTIDGGSTWKTLTFNEKPESPYTIDFAYVKPFDENIGTIYVGTNDLEQPNYYKYVSDDYGITWRFVGVVNTVRFISELQKKGI